jgi:GNAT superfamily N-acetyltransferase
MTGRIDAVFVDPECMGQGVGSRVMQHLERLAVSLGIAELSLDSTLNAAPFYRALGYVGDQPSAFQSPRGFSLACVPMSKRLQAQGKR